MDGVSGATPLPEMSAFDALAMWRSRPDATTTIALCNWIAGHGGTPSRASAVGRETVMAIGRESVRQHPQRVGVLIAVGRMLLVAGELQLALDTLIEAAKLAPREPIVFRLLGEVAFRRGDARRAARMLERAVAEGMTDPETLAWHQRARLCAMRAEARNDEARSVRPPMPSSATPPSGVRTRSGVQLSAAAAGKTSSHTAITRVGRD